jgi:hypothetical protein
MADNTIAAPNAEGKEDVRGKLTEQEIALIAEMAESMTHQEIAALIAGTLRGR